MLKNNNKIAIVLCGHGSSFNLYIQDFKKNHKIIEKQINTNCYICFIEKNEPNIENCLQLIKKKELNKLFFFLFYYLMENILNMISNLKLKSYQRT